MAFFEASTCMARWRLTILASLTQGSVFTNGRVFVRSFVACRSTGISLYYQMEEEALKGYTKERKGNDFLVNLIDSPGACDRQV